MIYGKNNSLAKDHKIQREPQDVFVYHLKCENEYDHQYCENWNVSISPVEGNIVLAGGYRLMCTKKQPTSILQ